ncbi:MAG: hypothetical protein OHK0047_01780 [Leptolyngbyaceae cyanobacterium]
MQGNGAIAQAWCKVTMKLRKTEATGKPATAQSCEVRSQLRSSGSGRGLNL